MSAERPEYRPDIDALRAWAVGAVLLFHLDLPWMRGGFVGVDVFFVISGYLITRNIRLSLEAGRFSLKSFYAKRARRLMPSLLVTLCLTTLGMWLLSATTHLMSAAKSTLGAALSISNVLFWKQTSYFDDALKLNPVTHTWSLSLEEQFYLLYPLLLIALTTRAGSRWRLLKGLSLFTLSSAALSLWLTPRAPAFAFFMVPTRLWEFSLGGLIWLLEPRLSAQLSGWRAQALFLGGAALVWGSCIGMSEYEPFPGWLALLPCVGAGFVILSRPQARGLGQLCAHPALVWLGRLSYALYLVHWPLIALWRHAHFELSLDLSAQLSLGLGSVLCALLLHKLVEEPLRARVRLSPRLSLIHALIASVALISLSSALIWRQELTVAHPALAELKLPTGLKLSDFKRETYGGAGCRPPRCSSSGVQPSAAAAEVGAYVIGDSYALALYQGLKAELDSSRLVFWERGACEFYSLNYAGHKNKGQARCVESKRRAFEELKANPELPVLLGQHWHANFHEEMRYLPSSPEGVALPAAPPATVRYDSIEAYASFVARELIELKAALGLKRLTILGGPPKFARVFSPLDCYLSPLRSLSCAERPLDEFTSWHRAFQEALTARSEGQFKVIDLYSALCTRAHEGAEERCSQLTPSAELIYSDYGHLSRWGAALVVSRKRAELSEALGLTQD